MKNVIQDRGYLNAGDIERIEYADGEVVEKPVYAKVDTCVYPALKNGDLPYRSIIEVFWVKADGTVNIRCDLAERTKIFFRKPDQPTE